MNQLGNIKTNFTEVEAVMSVSEENVEERWLPCKKIIYTPGYLTQKISFSFGEGDSQSVKLFNPQTNMQIAAFICKSNETKKNIEINILALDELHQHFLELKQWIRTIE